MDCLTTASHPHTSPGHEATARQSGVMLTEAESQCQDQHWESLRSNGGSALSPASLLTPLHKRTLKTGTTSVWELSRMEESLGFVPGQVSTVTTRPGATCRGPGGGVVGQCSVRR